MASWEVPVRLKHTHCLGLVKMLLLTPLAGAGAQDSAFLRSSWMKPCSRLWSSKGTPLLLFCFQGFPHLTAFSSLAPSSNLGSLSKMHGRRPRVPAGPPFLSGISVSWAGTKSPRRIRSRSSIQSHRLWGLETGDLFGRTPDSFSIPHSPPWVGTALQMALVYSTSRPAPAEAAALQAS